MFEWNRDIVHPTTTNQFSIYSRTKMNNLVLKKTNCWLYQFSNYGDDRKRTPKPKESHRLQKSTPDTANMNMNNPQQNTWTQPSDTSTSSSSSHLELNMDKNAAKSNSKKNRRTQGSAAYEYFDSLDKTNYLHSCKLVTSFRRGIMILRKLLLKTPTLQVYILTPPQEAIRRTSSCLEIYTISGLHLWRLHTKLYFPNRPRETRRKLCPSCCCAYFFASFF